MKKYVCPPWSWVCLVLGLFFFFPAISHAQGNFVTFSSATYSAKKTDGTATITVNFTRVLGNTGMITVFYQAGPGGTATPGVDYAPTAGQLTLPAGSPGSYSLTFTVQLVNSGIPDGTTTVPLALSMPMNATIGPTGNATLTITDSASPIPQGTVAFEFSSWTYDENAGQATITVLMTGSTSVPVSVRYATSDGSAKAGINYVPSSGILTWQPTDAGKTMSFAILLTDDGHLDPTLTVNLTLSAPVNAQLGSQSTAVLNIADTDSTCP